MKRRSLRNRQQYRTHLAGPESKRLRMEEDARAAFGDVAMLDNAMLVVWTRGQMNGLRATIKRLRMV